MNVNVWRTQINNTSPLNASDDHIVECGPLHAAGGLSFSAEAEAGRRAQHALHCASMPVLPEVADDQHPAPLTPLRCAVAQSVITTSDPRLSAASFVPLPDAAAEGRQNAASWRLCPEGRTSADKSFMTIRTALAAAVAANAVEAEGSELAHGSMSSSSFDRHLKGSGGAQSHSLNTSSVPTLLRPPGRPRSGAAASPTTAVASLPAPFSAVLQNSCAIASPFAAADVQVRLSV